MINIARSQKTPDSLSNDGIKKYIDEIEAYKNDQQLPKEKQTLIKPKCNELYRSSDLFEAFDCHFFKKMLFN